MPSQPAHPVHLRDSNNPMSRRCHPHAGQRRPLLWFVSSAHQSPHQCPIFPGILQRIHRPSRSPIHLSYGPQRHDLWSRSQQHRQQEHRSDHSYHLRLEPYPRWSHHHSDRVRRRLPLLRQENEFLPAIDQPLHWYHLRCRPKPQQHRWT